MTDSSSVRSREALLVADLRATLLFVVTAVAAAIRPSWFAGVAAAVSIGLFGVGFVVMWMSFLRAVERSRREVIGIAGLYFGAGSAPSDVQRRLNGLLAAQVVVGIATASARPFTSLAFGTLVPLFGIAMTGLWCASHGEFPARDDGGEHSSDR